MRRLIIALAGLFALAPVALATQLSLTGAGPSSVGPASYPLDGISNVTLALSFRQLRSAYTGNCVRLRRASDSTEQTFSLSGGLCDPSGIATFCASTSCSVVTWYDQSGNGNDFTQGTSANQPAYVASGIGSVPSLQYDGSNDTIEKASTNLLTLFSTNQGTWFVVQQQDGSQTNNTTLFCDPAGATFRVHATYSNTLYFDFASTGGTGRISAAQPTGWDGSNRIVEGYRATGGTQELLENGNSLVSASRSATLGSDTAVFIIGNDASGDYLKGYIAEIVLMQTDIGSSERSSVRVNQGSYYGITVTP